MTSISQSLTTSKHTAISQEIPDLLEGHLDQLYASAISPDVILERGYKSVLKCGPDIENPPFGYENLGRYGFKQPQLRLPAILMPLYGVDGKIVLHQIRPDNPRISQLKTGDRPIKYETPGRGMRLDIPPRCLKSIGDPSTPLFITEGIKKGDSLATAGACAVALLGVWNWRGTNDAGGKTMLPEFESIALNDRTVYICYDSDIISKPEVMKAMKRLAAALQLRKAFVKAIHLPEGKNGAKTGVDDYLATGHNLEDVKALAQDIEKKAPRTKTAIESIYTRNLPYAEDYCISNNRHCWKKFYYDREEREMKEQIIELCDFTASITADFLRDDDETDQGKTAVRWLRIEGKLSSGYPLPPVEVTSKDFMNMNWVAEKWGSDAGLRPGNMMKDHLRAAIETNSPQIRKLSIYTHTGWRTLPDGSRVYLTEGGAIDNPIVQVDQEPRLKRYSIGKPDVDPAAAFKGSLKFLDVGPHIITLPIYDSVYLAPLCEILDPAFLIWLYGASGSGKSTLSSLALCHFGHFDQFHLPVSWDITLARIEYSMFAAKDILFVIDDLPPGADANARRAQESLVRRVIHNVGNKQGRGRMAGGGVAQKDYYPRGLIMSSGEHLPGGHSDTARYFPVRFFKDCLNMPVLTKEQENTVTYRAAMYYYIIWLRDRWKDMGTVLKKQFELYRDKARSEQPGGAHGRLAEAVSYLHLGLITGLMCAVDYGAMSQAAADVLIAENWDILVQICAEQSENVEQERPAVRFIDALRTLRQMRRIAFYDVNGIHPEVMPAGQELIGFTDSQQHPEILYLFPSAAYSAVFNYYNHLGQAFFNEGAVWKDMSEQGYLIEQTPRPGDKHKSSLRWLDGKPQRVRLLKRELLDEDFRSQGEVLNER